jgi:DNA-binding CsgD family transcriptional regulator
LLPLAPSLLAEAQVAAGEPVAALAVARALAAVDGGAPYTAAAAARLEGLARSVLGEHAAALACLERAGTAFAALELPFEAARARMEWAALATTSDPSAAQTALTESLAAFERLGAGRYADRTRRLLRELGVRPPAPRRSRPTGGALSARELEVARLVADRLTNAEIASRLVLSPRTVTTHLERIYARLGIGSRGELARYVVAAGLVAATGEIA